MQTTPTSPVRWTTSDLEIFESDRVNRYEIIDGELFATRAPDWKHQAVCINIGTVLNYGQIRAVWVNQQSPLASFSQN